MHKALNNVTHFGGFFCKSILSFKSISVKCHNNNKCNTIALYFILLIFVQLTK